MNAAAVVARFARVPRARRHAPRYRLRNGSHHFEFTLHVIVGIGTPSSGMGSRRSVIRATRKGCEVVCLSLIRRIGLTPRAARIRDFGHGPHDEIAVGHNSADRAVFHLRAEAEEMPTIANWIALPRRPYTMVTHTSHRQRSNFEALGKSFPIADLREEPHTPDCHASPRSSRSLSCRSGDVDSRHS